MTTDNTPVQQHLDDAGRYSGEADRLLATARREIGYQDANYARITAQVQAAGVYAQLAQISATAAQTAALLPATDDQEQ